MTIRDLIRDGFPIDAELTVAASESLVVIASVEHVPAANSSCPGKLAMIPRREVSPVDPDDCDTELETGRTG